VTIEATSVLDVKNLNVEFGRKDQWKTVVSDVSFSIADGETLGLVGESGSGKSVTSMAVLRLLDPAFSRVTATSVELAGEDVLAMRPRRLRQIRGAVAGMIFQQARASLDPAFTVGEQIAEGIRAHFPVSKKQAWEQAVEMLDRVHISNARQRAKDYPHQFSGGMCQRVMIASVVALRPRLIIADEPTTALDVTVQARIIELLKEVQAEMGLAMLFISHDLGLVAEVCDRVSVMYSGSIVEQNTAGGVFLAPKHPYTRALLNASPELQTRGKAFLTVDREAMMADAERMTGVSTD
jgi:ABC-type dipeptide/oligopeptide/nickel transport system ATPase component